MKTTDASRARTAPSAAPADAASLARRLPATLLRRVIVEHIRPSVQDGAESFAIKRTPGETVDVEADVFADGHDRVAAALLFRRSGPEAAGAWTEVRMTPRGNDEWTASFTVTDLGEYEYTVEGWIDRVATWLVHLDAKWQAAQDVSVELQEGAALVRSLAPGAPREEWLLGVAAILDEEREEVSRRVAAARDPQLAVALTGRADRSRATRAEPPLRVLVDRERARFGAWYEMFPRSAVPASPGAPAVRSRGATFAEAADRLRAIADLGFDIVYLPPIHPIGRTFRKGPNNALEAGPDDPGSPWAIGHAEGGHMAVEPSLGTIDDFREFVAVAERVGLEVALDLAYQASPDHPYVTEHPEWFRHRPDGSIRYAENPPKRYQDIYPFDLEGQAWRELWVELRRIVAFWIEHGVRIFRVDNPHTKPLRFWQWLIADLKRDHPDAIFLAEAFTRPKVMRYLAKAGFDQSYSYFTWRNTKAELVEYFTELTGPVAEYMRPNLFANTPDILHEYLQHGGRPAFAVRLILAATLGASYGIYSGFELCENVPVRQGSEEYLDSEKYQIKPRDWTQPGNLNELITRVNQIRRENRALQFDRSLRFHETDNPELIFYGKRHQANIVFVVVNLDPHHMQHGWVRVPIWELGIQADEHYVVRDLLDDETYTWRGEWNYVRLDPEIAAAHILRVETRPDLTSPDARGP
jgi:starch synthase (maltosyl-transferring)